MIVRLIYFSHSFQKSETCFIQLNVLYTELCVSSIYFFELVITTLMTHGASLFSQVN